MKKQSKIKTLLCFSLAVILSAVFASCENEKEDNVQKKRQYHFQ